jgi:hypothetical protein
VLAPERQAPLTDTADTAPRVRKRREKQPSPARSSEEAVYSNVEAR